MSALTAICPTCSLQTLEGVCPRCALHTALAGLTDSDDLAPSPHDIPPPAGYDLVREIGAGATAVVWLARERKLDRLVALKLMAANAERGLSRRLIREGQAAARLHHPHIVSVHTLGETPQHAFLAMDFLEGGDLRQRLAREPLAPRDSAELVRKLADALAHAHANGVLHRDIKPSNVLLDAAGEPHLADFGLAAPLEGGGDLTLPGTVAGTPAYLAPELLAGADHATPQSDIYGLGALLYECLTGRPPFVGDTAASLLAQLARDEPPAPRLLRPTIPRDLETICLKCLEKNGAGRYASAGALHDDLGHFLRGEPIAARSISTAGKVVRWCRRNPATAACAAAAAVLLLALAIGGPLAALRLARANARAEREAAASRAVSEFLQNDLLAKASPEQQPDRDLKLRTVLDRAAENIAGRFPDQPLVEADVRETLASTYVSLGEYALAHAQWQRAHSLRERQLGADDPKTLHAVAGDVEALRRLGKFGEMEALALRVLERQRRVLGVEHPETLSSLNNLGLAQIKTSKLAEAEKTFTELVALRERVSGRDHPDTIAALHNLASTYLRLEKHAEGERLSLAVLERARRVFGSDHPNTLMVLNNAARMYQDFDNNTEAEKLCREALERRQRVLGPEHPDTLVSQSTLAKIFSAQGRFEESLALDREVLAVQKRRLGAEHPDVLTSLHNLACNLRDQARFAEAESLHREALALFRKVYGAEHPFVFISLNKVTGIACDQGRFDEAARLGEETLAACERILGPAHACTVQARHLLGVARLKQGDFARAEPLLHAAIEGYARMPLPAWRLAIARSRLGEAWLNLRRYSEAEAVLSASLEVLRQNAARLPPADRAEPEAIAALLTRLRTEAPPRSATAMVR